PTRGAVMAVLALGQLGQQQETTLELASVGNVTIELVQARESRRFGGASFVLGTRQRACGAQVTHAASTPHEVVVLFTDGVSSRATIEGDFGLLREHPVVIAHQLVE